MASPLEIKIWIWQPCLVWESFFRAQFFEQLLHQLMKRNQPRFITLRWETYAIFKVGSKHNTSYSKHESVFVCDIFRQMLTPPIFIIIIIISKTPLAKFPLDQLQVSGFHLKFTKPVSQKMVSKLIYTKLELQVCFSKFTKLSLFNFSNSLRKWP